MKKPDKIIKFLHVVCKPNEPFIDHNGKPLYDYFIEIPYWIAKAYKPWMVKVEFSTTPFSIKQMREIENHEEADNYVKNNWSAKLTKMRKLNHNYMLVSTKAMGRSWFKSLEDYENYHKELKELDRKYGL